jgi:hypothetical protein
MVELIFFIHGKEAAVLLSAFSDSLDGEGEIIRDGQGKRLWANQ